MKNKTKNATDADYLRIRDFDESDFPDVDLRVEPDDEDVMKGAKEPGQ